MFETQQIGFAPPPEKPRGPGPATIIGTLVLTVVLGAAAAFVTVVGFWPDPAPATYRSKAVDTVSAATHADKSALPGTRVTLDQAVPSTTAAAGSGRWPLVAADEFDGLGLDQARWQPYSGAGRGGAESRSPQRLAVAGGALTITGQGTGSGGMAWRTEQTYGRWEARVRVEPGAGYRPALLLWPAAEDWPTGGELDFLDIPKADRSESNFVVHYGPDNERDGATASGDFTGWHNYAVEWMPDHIAGFVDGQQVFRTEDPAKIPTRPMHLVIQQDVGPSPDGWIPPMDASTPPQVKMQVDWVRIYAP